MLDPMNPKPGDIFEVKYPFILEPEVEVGFDEDGPCIAPSWIPATYKTIGDRWGGSHEYDEGFVWADGEGLQILEVISIHKPGRFPARVFYVQQWQSPDGRRFGAKKCRVLTLEAFRRRCRGFLHPYRLDQPQQKRTA